jgi:hypothetical protein
VCVNLSCLCLKKEAGGLGLRGWERPLTGVQDEAQVVPCTASDPGNQDHQQKPAQTFVDFDAVIDTGRIFFFTKLLDYKCHIKGTGA